MIKTILLWTSLAWAMPDPLGMKSIQRIASQNSTNSKLVKLFHTRDEQQTANFARASRQYFPPYYDYEWTIPTIQHQYYQHFHQNTELPSSYNHLRIAGGETAAQGAYKFIVSIQHYSKGKFRHICGGSIITSDVTPHDEPPSSVWILTAAHCFTHIRRKDLRVVASTNSLTHDPGNAFAVKTLRINTYYQPGTYGYDIALLQLHPQKCKATACAMIPITLARTDVGAGTVMEAIGYGEVVTDGHLPRYLQVVTVYVLLWDSCREYFRALHKNELCTTAPAGKGICDGDSGGPLIMSNGAGHPALLYGVIANSKSCGSSPQAYIDVTQFRRWIHYYAGV